MSSENKNDLQIDLTDAATKAGVQGIDVEAMLEKMKGEVSPRDSLLMKGAEVFMTPIPTNEELASEKSFSARNNTGITETPAAVEAMDEAIDEAYSANIPTIDIDDATLEHGTVPLDFDTGLSKAEIVGDKGLTGIDSIPPGDDLEARRQAYVQRFHDAPPSLEA